MPPLHALATRAPVWATDTTLRFATARGAGCTAMACGAAGAITGLRTGAGRRTFTRFTLRFGAAATAMGLRTLGFTATGAVAFGASKVIWTGAFAFGAADATAPGFDGVWPQI
ncbi:hypothetical protein N8Z32_01755 [Ascidiaceihabitans sp.]|nr:hypothetical protein [Ascidiaceihabitans sp.]